MLAHGTHSGNGSLPATEIVGRRQENFVLAWWPAQERTGSRGYFGKFRSLSESRHSRNSEPFAERITRAWVQSWQSPAASGCRDGFSGLNPTVTQIWAPLPQQAAPGAAWAFESVIRRWGH